MSEFGEIIEFSRELEKLKLVSRANMVLGGARKENSAEHSWHTAMIALAFAERFEARGVDMNRVIQMLLLHDIVEIDAGDTFFYSAEVATQAEREASAANRIYGMLPESASNRMRVLFDEFEAMETPESRVAKALDYFQPLLNYIEVGLPYTEHNRVYYGNVIDKKTLIGEVDDELWALALEIIIECKNKGLYSSEERR